MEKYGKAIPICLLLVLISVGNAQDLENSGAEDLITYSDDEVEVGDQTQFLVKNDQERVTGVIEVYVDGELSRSFRDTLYSGTIELSESKIEEIYGKEALESLEDSGKTEVEVRIVASDKLSRAEITILEEERLLGSIISFLNGLFS